MSIYGSKDSKSIRTSKLHDWFKSYNNFTDIFCPWLIWVFFIWNQFTVDNGRVSRGSSVAVGVSDQWKVTCDMRHMTCYIWNVTCDLWQKSQWKCKKCKLMAKKKQKVLKSVIKAGFHSIGCTIRTREESRCLLNAGFCTVP